MPEAPPEPRPDAPPAQRALAAKALEEWHRTVAGPSWAMVYAAEVARLSRQVGRAAAAAELGLSVHAVDRLVTRASRRERAEMLDSLGYTRAAADARRGR